MADSKGHMAEELLQRAHSPTTASSIFTERIKQRPLLLRPTSPELPDPKRAKLRSKVRDAREQRRAARDVRNGNAQSTRSKKQKPLSAKQKRALQIYAIPKEQRKYELYLPLHELWCTYMREILGMQSGQENTVHQHRMRPVTAASQGPILVSADYHGAILEVVRSRCVTRVGVKGIVLKDTKFTFEIITIGNAIKVLPKEHSVFRFEVPFVSTSGGPDETPRKPLVFEIQGSQFESRPQDRANKKFKSHIDKEV